jgi:hypothetical protein
MRLPASRHDSSPVRVAAGGRVVSGLEAAAYHPGGHVGIRLRLVVRPFAAASPSKPKQFRAPLDQRAQGREQLLTRHDPYFVFNAIRSLYSHRQGKWPGR